MEGAQLTEPVENLFRYANVYGCGHIAECEFDDDLGSLVWEALRRAENGEGTRGDFWEMTGDTWTPVDVTEHVARWGQFQSEAYDLVATRQQATPWRVWVFGPGDSNALWWSAHATEAEARAEAEALPRILTPIIGTDTQRPPRPT